MLICVLYVCVCAKVCSFAILTFGLVEAADRTNWQIFQWYVSSCHLGEATTDHQGRVGPQKSHFRSKLVLSGPLWLWIWTWKGQNQVQVISPDVFQWYLSSFNLSEAITDHQGQVGPQKGHFRSKWDLVGPLGHQMWLFENPKMVFINDLSYHHHLENFLLQYKSCVA